MLRVEDFVDFCLNRADQLSYAAKACRAYSRIREVMLLAMHILNKLGLFALSASVSLCSPGATKALTPIDARIELKKQIVAILTPGSSGTGTVVGFNQGQYSALTAAHVLKDFNNKEELFAVSPRDGSRYRITNVYIPRKGLDIAVFTFRAPSNRFNITPINALNPLRKQPYRGGFGEDTPLASTWDVLNDGARGAGLSLPSKSVGVPVYRYNEFTTQERVKGNKDGYEFIYSASTVPGMSGGPIVGFRETCFYKKKHFAPDGRPLLVDAEDWKDFSPEMKESFIANTSQEPSIAVGAIGYMSLIAIHGRSEESSYGGRSGTSLGVPIDLIANHLRNNSKDLGIPLGFNAVNDVATSQYCTSLTDKSH